MSSNSTTGPTVQSLHQATAQPIPATDPKHTTSLYKRWLQRLIHRGHLQTSTAPPVRGSVEFDQGIDARQQAIIGHLLAAINDQANGTRAHAGFDHWLMQWTFSDQQRQTQVLRFVEKLPALATHEDISTHLRQCFLAPGLRLPVGMRWFLGQTHHSRILSSLSAWAAQQTVRRMAKRFVAGPSQREMLATLRNLHQRGLAFSIGRLPLTKIFKPFHARDLADRRQEATADPDQVTAYTKRLIETLNQYVPQWPAAPESSVLNRTPFGDLPTANISLKLSSLCHRFDPQDPDRTVAEVTQRLRPILQSARDRGLFIHIDMEQYAYKDLTLRIFKQVLAEPAFRDWEHVGIAMQAYLRETERDLDELYAWAEQRGTPVFVRLVKGAYWNHEVREANQRNLPVPVFTSKCQTDAQFDRLAERLVRRWRTIRPAIASHNLSSVSRVLAVMDDLNLAPGTVEFQVLYGVADRLADTLTARGERVRVYVPHGELVPAMADLVRRLMHNGANQGFVQEALEIPKQPLMNPSPTAN